MSPIEEHAEVESLPGAEHQGRHTRSDHVANPLPIQDIPIDEVVEPEPATGMPTASSFEDLSIERSRVHPHPFVSLSRAGSIDGSDDTAEFVVEPFASSRSPQRPLARRHQTISALGSIPRLETSNHRVVEHPDDGSRKTCTPSLFPLARGSRDREAPARQSREVTTPPNGALLTGAAIDVEGSSPGVEVRIGTISLEVHASAPVASTAPDVTPTTTTQQPLHDSRPQPPSPRFSLHRYYLRRG